MGEADADLALYRLLVESVRDYAIFALDAGGHIRTWNPGAQRFKGYTYDEIVGKHFSIFYPPEDQAAGKPAWELEVAAEVGKYEEEGWRVRKDGSRFWAGVLITAVRDATGTLVGYAKVTRDLTERRQAELRALDNERRAAAAEAASRAKSEFLASMSHELRTPLNAIGGYADLLALEVHGSLTDEQARDVQRITASQQHLLAIINDILDYSRIEGGRLTYERVPVPLDVAVGEVASMVQPLGIGRGVKLVAAAHRVVACADRLKVEQVLLNLLANALKFTPRGGRVTVECGERDAHAFVTVADTGIGIPPEQVEQIFEPFVQVGRSLTSGHEGTGLGLSISRTLARGMGGELAVESTPGEGSVFTLTLPLVRGADADEGGPRNAPRHRSSRGPGRGE